MNTQAVLTTIQLVVAPVVMVSACAILLSGILSRYAVVNDRLRAMGRERFELLRSAGAAPHAPAERLDAWSVERIDEIDRQTPDLLRRHHLIHNAALVLYYAIALFIVCMFAIAIAASTSSGLAAKVVLALFLGAVAVLLIAVLLTAVEVRSSDRAVEYEAQRIAMLGKSKDGSGRR